MFAPVCREVKEPSHVAVANVVQAALEDFPKEFEFVADPLAKPPGDTE